MPYHIVHFDGHGLYTEHAQAGRIAGHFKQISSVVYTARRSGKHGFILFEDPDVEDNTRLVDGPSLGALLVEAGVPVLVLNACRSAHAEIETASKPTEADTVANPHAQVRAIGSLAQEVMDAGVAGVVAMRYNVYVVTAAQFVADLYSELVRGQSLGEAVSMGRKQLAANPERTIVYDSYHLQDWCVPVVYEAAPIRLFRKARANGLKITVHGGDASSRHGTIDERLPKPPDVGFFGRDETLLSLDRAFDTQSIVLMHAYAGSGKTSTAAEFARWYALTGGVVGPVLFTSFEQYMPLARVLDRIGQFFGPILKKSGVHWLALDESQRRDVALQTLKQAPILWIWDNVEPIAGFPEGTPSTWSEAEQDALVAFLRDARQTKAKFLLTSRRDERFWLGDLPSRIAIVPMPMQERVQLARALSAKYNLRITSIKDWRPLLWFTDGNPLAITVLVGQALRDGLKTRAQIEDFVSKLQAGEAQVEEDEREGRSRSLGAALSYGFENAFTETERGQLALLHLFQGFIDVRVLCAMGDSEAEQPLAAVRGLTREGGISLLDRAAEVGILTSLGNGYYTIHPAAPWYFKRIFDKFYTKPGAGRAQGAADACNSQAASATRAYIDTICELGNFYSSLYDRGNRDIISLLTFEESNLLYARHLAFQNGCWTKVLEAMRGLFSLYNQTGRRAEWARLVEEISPNFVDPTTGGPQRGYENEWGMLTQHRVRLAQERRDWSEANRLLCDCVNWNRRQVEAIVKRRLGCPSTASATIDDAEVREYSNLDAKDESRPYRERLGAVMGHLNDDDRQVMRQLGTSLHELAQIQRGRSEAGCVATYREGFDIAEMIGDREGIIACALNMGNSYMNIPSILNLDQAEFWYRRSLEHRVEEDRLGRGRSLNSLGNVSLARFQDARATSATSEETLRHLNQAILFYQEALDLIPESALDDMAIVLGSLGSAYSEAGDINHGLENFQKSIQLKEVSNMYSASQTRFNVAVFLDRFGRFEDALMYATAARTGFASYGEKATDEVHRAEELIASIVLHIARKKS